MKKREITIPNRLIIFVSSIVISGLPLVFRYWLRVPENFTYTMIKDTFAPIICDIDVLHVIISFSFNIIIQRVAMPIQNRKNNSPAIFSLWTVYFILMIIIYTAGGLNQSFLRLYQSSHFWNLILGGIAILFCIIYFFYVAYFELHASEEELMQDLAKSIK